jgi:hypothetical protein
MRMKRQKRRLLVVPRSLSLLDECWSNPFEISMLTFGLCFCSFHIVECMPSSVAYCIPLYHLKSAYQGCILFFLSLTLLDTFIYCLSSVL